MTLEERKQEKVELANKVDELRATGVRGHEACKQVGIAFSTYNSIKARNKRNKDATVTFTKVESPKREKKEKSVGKVALIIGSPREVSHFLEGFI